MSLGLIAPVALGVSGPTYKAPTRLRFGLETVGGCGGANIKYIKNMGNKLQGSLSAGFIGNGWETLKDFDIKYKDYPLKEGLDIIEMVFASLRTTITSDKIHLIKTTKLLRV